MTTSPNGHALDCECPDCDKYGAPWRRRAMTQPTPESRMSDAEPIRGRFVIQLSDDEHAALKAAAALIPVSMHDFVHAALTDFLGRAGTLAFSETAFHQGYLAATAHLSAEREELREALREWRPDLEAARMALCKRLVDHDPEVEDVRDYREAEAALTLLADILSCARKLVGGR